MIESIPYILTGIGIIVSILYYTSVLRNQNKTRHAQLFVNVYQHYFDKDWLRDQQEINLLFEDYNSLDEFFEKYGPWTNMEGYLTYMTRANFYEGLGVLVKRGLIDVTMVDDLLSGPIVLFWEKRTAPIVDELRERYNNPAALEWVEYLYHKVKAIRDKQLPDRKGITPGPNNSNS